MAGLGEILFSVSKTGRKAWDDFLASPKGEVEMMSPDALMDKMAQGQGTTKTKAINKRLARGGQEKIDNLKQLLNQGTEVDMPVLDYDRGGFQQDGFHRALAAKELGMEKLPVAVIKRYLAQMAPVAVGGAAALQSDDSEAAFVGTLSKMVQKDPMMHMIAKKMDELGYPREEIFDNTSWFKDEFGDWKMEVPDHNMKIYDYDEWAKPTSGPVDPTGSSTLDLEGFVRHPDLFAHYPEMDKSLINKKDGTGSSYSPTGQPASGDMGDINLATMLRKRSDDPLYNDPEGILGHEIQHGIQDIEGFSQGGSPSTFDKKLGEKKLAEAKAGTRRLDQMKETFGKRRHEMSPEKQRNVLEVMDNYWAKVEDLYDEARNLRPYEQYLRIGGESEARNVTNRKVNNYSRYTLPARTKEEIANNTFGQGNRYPWASADRDSDLLLKSPLDSPTLIDKFKPWYEQQKKRGDANKPFKPLQDISSNPLAGAVALGNTTLSARDQANYSKVNKEVSNLMDIIGKTPGYTYGDILPVKRSNNPDMQEDDIMGGYRLAMPNVARDITEALVRLKKESDAGYFNPSNALDALL